MIKRLVVKGLNNRADGTHDLEFHPDLNIFTGPNGSGKTTLLKLIWYLISGNLERIFPEIPFRFVSIETDVFSLEIDRVETDRVKIDKVDLRCEFPSRNSKYVGMHRGKIVLDCRAERANGTTWSELVMKHGVKESTLKSWVKRSQHLMEAAEIHAFLAPKNAQRLSPQIRTFTVDSETGNLRSEDEFWLNAIKQRIALGTKSSLFFPTFRRIEGGFSSESRYAVRDPIRASIRRMSYRTTGKLQEAMSELSDTVSVYNHRFIASISTDDIAALLTQRYAGISERINKREVQLSEEIKRKIRDRSGDPTVVLDAIEKSVQQVDKIRALSFRPFSVFGKFAQGILKHRAIRFTGQVNRDEGTERITLGEGTYGITLEEVKGAISSDKLSAGEKQMLSFLCYNAFSDNAAIFIDEPELSLHLDWQGLLLPTLLDQATGNQFFVATHSPFIYTIYPDKEFLLGDNRGYQGKI